MKIIDIHVHAGDLLYGWPLTEAYEHPVWTFGAVAEWSGFRLSRPPPGFRTISRYLEIIHAHHRNNLATISNLRKFALAAGITHSVLMPVEPWRKTVDNLSLCYKYNAARPGHRLFTFASVDPRDPEGAANLKSYLEAGCLGLKIHPILQDLPLTDQRWFDLVAAVAPYKRPVLIHAGKSTYHIPYFRRTEYGGVRTFERMIAAFPGQPFILAHMNLYEPAALFHLARKYDNIFCDASFQSAATIRRAFREMGESRVLFASDFPFSLPRFAVQAGMSATKGRPDLREKFFFGNAAALIPDLAHADTPAPAADQR